MSGTTSLSLATPAPPTTSEAAADYLSWVGGQSGVLTDFNVGSQVRTDAEAAGSVIDIQSVIAQAQAFSAIVYAGYAAFNIYPLSAESSNGIVTFTTGSGSSPPPAPFAVTIPTGTIVQTAGGSQFQTTEDVTLAVSGTTVNATVSAVDPGATGNVAASSINQLVTSLAYPFVVSNAAATTGGEDAETPTQTMTRFTAAVAAIGLATPVAVANACIGVSVSGTGETVEYSTVYEPWIAQAASGVTNPTPGFVVYVDNGSGAASSNLLAAVTVKLNGNQNTGQYGNRPAGVPYGVSGVVPVYADVIVSGTAVLSDLDAQLEASTLIAVQQYFSTLQFGQAAELTGLIPAVANVVVGNVTSLEVVMTDVSGTAQQQISANGNERVILQTTTINFN